MSTKAKHLTLIAVSWIFMGITATVALANHEGRVADLQNAAHHPAD